jgi:hypothetical protein
MHGKACRWRLPGGSVHSKRAKAFPFRKMNGTMLSNRWNWQKLFSYGEVICFVSAWAVGLLVAMQNQRPNTERTFARTFASTADTLAIQAVLRR